MDQNGSGNTEPPLFLIAGRAASQDGQQKLTEDEVDALETVIAYTSHAVPRTFGFCHTEGSVENGITGCGAVLCKKGLKARVLQLKVPQSGGRERHAVARGSVC
eukprot:2457547-Amphidinium_carterae.2